MTIHYLQAPVHLAVIALLAIGLGACSQSSETDREGAGGEGPSEHISSSEHGQGAESGEGGEESATQFTQSQIYDETRGGARLVLRYDPTAQAFVGTVTNMTNATLSRVRVEVHLSNGVELGPSTPMDLAPGQSIDVSLPAVGQIFTTWGAHPEVGSGGESSSKSGGQRAGESGNSAAFTPSLAGWAVMNGVSLGVENQQHVLSAWYTSQGSVRNPHLSPSAPADPPTGNASWTGEWAGVYGPGSAVSSGAATIDVTLGTGTEADLTLTGVPVLGTLQWDHMPVGGGRFAGTATANSQSYEAVGQFGGTNQAGVVGHATGSDFRSVFYGNKN